MQRLATYQNVAFVRPAHQMPGREAVFANVHLVRNDRHANMLHVDPQLMRTPCVWMKFHERKTSEGFCRFVKCDRLTSSVAR